MDPSPVHRTLSSTPAGAPPAHPLAAIPTLASDPRSGADPGPTVTIPGYKVLGELGRGGMGVVYKARQVPLNRLVALKMVLSGVHAGETELTRFRREAEALARLQHPNIVQVYEVGEHEGRPFFSLEFVEGGSLDKKLEGKPLPPQEAAALLEVLARAVAAAHQRGVLHRDLKPANVLLTVEGTPKLTDFGLAKKIEGSAGQTASGAVLGTPSYMPPEQALGELKKIGPCADVYSLGAVLYELLTGRPPFLADTPLNTVFQVVTAEPVPPGRLNSRIPRDLETIALKCLQKEPPKRYASALDLAEDLRRFRAGEPILARPVGRLGLWVKWVKRRPAVAALWGLALAAVLIGPGVWLWWAQTQAERRAEAVVALEQARTEVERLRRPGPEGLPADLALWSAASAAARRAEALLEASGDEDARRQLRALLAELEALERDRRMVGRLEQIRLGVAEQASFNRTTADKEYAAAFRDYGIDLDALPAAEAAARLRARPVKEQLAALVDHWAMMRQARRQGDGVDWRRLLEVARLVDPDPARNRVRDAVARADDRALKLLAGEKRVARLPAATVILLADALTRRKDWPTATRLLRRAQPWHPADFWINNKLAYCLSQLQPPALEERVRYLTAALALRPRSPTVHMNLGHALHAKGDVAGAIAEGQEAIRLKPDYAEPHNNLGNALHDQGDEAGALREYRQAIRLKKNYPEAHYNLGLTLHDQGDLAGAIAAYRQAIRFKKDLTPAYINLGIALADKGRLDEAMASFKEAIRLKKDDADAHFSLGTILSLKGDLPGAIASFQEAIRLKRDYAEAHCNLAIALQARGDVAGAIACFQEVVRDADAHHNLGLALRKKGLLDRAIASFQAIVRLKKDDADAHFNLGYVLQVKGDVARASTAYREAIRLKKDYPLAYHHLGILLAGQGRLDEAIAAYQQAIRLQKNYPLAYHHLGLALHRKGQLDQAIAAFQEAVRLQKDNVQVLVSLGNALDEKGDVAGAIASYYQAIDLKKDYAPAHLNLGITLMKLRRLDEAIAALKEAIRLKQDDVAAHVALGNALDEKGDVAGAIASYHKAIGLKKDHGPAHYNLGITLLNHRRFAEALAALKRAQQLGARNPRWSYPTAALIRRAERLAVLDARLPAILQGQAQPASAAERIEYARLCQLKKLYAAAAGLFDAAFRADAKLADDLQSSNRYNAACVAALAAAGQGNEGPLPDQERKRWRKQALVWLRADLTLWTRQLDQGTAQAAARIKGTLQHWQQNADLAGLREAAAVAKLPKAERQAWRRFWADVKTLLRRVQGAK